MGDHRITRGVAGWRKQPHEGLRARVARPASLGRRPVHAARPGRPPTAELARPGRPRTARPRSASTASRGTSRNSRPRSATRSKATTNGVAGTLSGVGEHRWVDCRQGRQTPSEPRPRRRRSRQSSGRPRPPASPVEWRSGPACSRGARPEACPIGRQPPAEVGHPRGAVRRQGDRQDRFPSRTGRREHGGEERQPVAEARLAARGPDQGPHDPPHAK